MLKKTAVVLMMALSLSACETAGPKQQSGAVLGAVVGGVIGSQFGGNSRAHLAAGVLGAAIGAGIGGSIGARLDAQDRARLREITTASIRSGKARSFRNAKTGVRATTKVIRTTDAGGKLCRTVQQDVTLPNGKTSRDTVSGCKGANGWSV